MLAVDPVELDPRAHDLTGFRSGRLVALVPTQHRVRNGIVWLCSCDCGESHAVQAAELKKGHTRSCGCLRRGADSSAWQGGRYTDVSGYVIRHEDTFSPAEVALLEPMFRPTRTVLEHRAVVAMALGRPLEPHEQVHHRNGAKDDNAIENLELWNRSHPEGWRAADVPHCPTCACGQHEEGE